MTTDCVDGVTARGSVRKSFLALTEAEAHARDVCRATGCGLFVVEYDSAHPRIVARVSRDNGDRIWTDVMQMEGALL